MADWMKAVCMISHLCRELKEWEPGSRPPEISPELLPDTPALKAQPSSHPPLRNRTRVNESYMKQNLQ